ncbi:MAG: HIT family hydrolase [Desulfurococcales archaeon ex4484_217_2]|nr:MAG: HIT family hydrolase [Desulfurococcales archaeon ex4484_217_2]
MKVIWAPWRIRYVEAPKPEGCFICEAAKSSDDRRNYVVYRGKNGFILMNLFPYNPGHLMVATYRHVGNLEELSKDELHELMELTVLSVKLLKKAFKPHGFNIGINLGSVAGAGIEDHIHIHIVPRWLGDTNFMPILADVKVVPQALEETYSKLVNAVKDLLKG